MFIVCVSYKLDGSSDDDGRGSCSRPQEQRRRVPRKLVLFTGGKFKVSVTFRFPPRASKVTLNPSPWIAADCHAGLGYSWHDFTY